MVLRIAAVLLRHLMEFLDAGLEARDRVEPMVRVVADREPDVAVAYRAAQRGRALAADPDRRVRLLHGLGQEGDLGEAHVAALETRVLLGPQDLERLQVLVGDAAALLERRRADRLELLLHPAGARAQHQAPVGKHVDRGCDLGGVHRGPIGDDRDRGDQAGPAGDRREPGQQRELLEAFARSRAGPCAGFGVGVAEVDIARHHQVIGYRQVVEAELLGAAHQGRDLVGGGERAARWNGQSDVHDGISLRLGWARRDADGSAAAVSGWAAGRAPGHGGCGGPAPCGADLLCAPRQHRVLHDR